jgi:2-desacetyl-2-hydroxyethyl bacteriochlorophyllide A dehydrogenase
MRAAVLFGAGDLRVEEVPVPRAGPGEVVIRVARCGICGTDLHIMRGSFPAPNLPLTLGHEFAGEIAEIGDGVAHVAVGDRATADINIACGTCFFCRRGHKLFCPDVRQLGVHTAGGLADYVVAPAANVYRLPASMSYEHAAYIEPLACTIHGQDRVAIQTGETVAIIGGGPMGLAHAGLAALRGAGRVIVSEPDENRRDTARALGADVVIDPFAADPVEQLRELTDGRGADVVIEAVGSARTYVQALEMARRGGRLLAFGAAPPDLEIPVRPFDIYTKELTIVGSYAGTYDTWPKAIELIAGGRFDPGLIVDSVRPLSDAREAIESLVADKSTVKVQVEVAAL